MTTTYLNIMQYPTRHKAKQVVPHACKIKKCYFGWMAFENMTEYENYMIEEKKSKTSYTKKQV